MLRRPRVAHSLLVGPIAQKLEHYLQMMQLGVLAGRGVPAATLAEVVFAVFAFLARAAALLAAQSPA